MAVDPIGSANGSGTTVFTSAALALSQQARQGVSEQVEQAIQRSTEPDQDKQTAKPVEDSKDSAEAKNQSQNQAAGSSSSPAAPIRGQAINIKG